MAWFPEETSQTVISISISSKLQTAFTELLQGIDNFNSNLN